MANCLVTKLKSVVDNDNLDVLGCVRINLNNCEYGRLGYRVSGTGPYIARAYGDAVFTNWDGSHDIGQETTLTIDSTQSIYFKGTGYVIIPTRYSSYTEFGTPSASISVNLKDFELCENYLSFGIPSNNECIIYGDVTDLKFHANSIAINTQPIDNVYGNLKKYLDYKNIQITELLLQDTNIEINLSDIEQCTNLDNFQAPAKIRGSFDSLGFTKLTQLPWQYRSGSRISGSVEGFVSNKIANGYTSGSLSLYTLNFPNVKYKGISFLESTEVPKGSATLSWDSQGNITWS